MVKPSQPNVPLLRSALLERYGFAHAFTTRSGGVSEGSLASLNLRMQPDEHRPALEENRARLRAALAMGPSRYHELKQVHGADVVWVHAEGLAYPASRTHRATQGEAERRNAPRGTEKEPELAGAALDPPQAADALEGDALIAAATTQAWVAMATADCVPVLIGDREGRHVAAVHAGWRGVVGGVLPAAIRQLLTDAGGGASSRVGDLCVAIGPHISVAHFEIGDEVAQALQHRGGAAAVQTRNGRCFGDLAIALRAQLAHLGVTPDAIEDLHRCTFAEDRAFFSHRRDHGITGRQLALIRSG